MKKGKETIEDMLISIAGAGLLLTDQILVLLNMAKERGKATPDLMEAVKSLEEKVTEVMKLAREQTHYQEALSALAGTIGKTKAKVEKIRDDAQAEFHSLIEKLEKVSRPKEKK